jgi:hypothetical protein
LIPERSNSPENTRNIFYKGTSPTRAYKDWEMAALLVIILMTPPPPHPPPSPQDHSFIVPCALLGFLFCFVWGPFFFP